MRRLLVALTVAAGFVSCGYDDFGNMVPEGEDMIPTVRISELRSLYRGESAEVFQDMVAAGHVIANDAGGNLYRTFVIEDDGASLEIMAGMYDLWASFPVGSYVAVSLRGLFLGTSEEVMQVGLKPRSSYYRTEYFGNRALLDKYVFRGRSRTDIEPAVVGLNELTMDMCGVLVRVEGLYATEESLGQSWAAEEGYAYRIFSDIAGDTVGVYTHSNADYARGYVPEGEVAVTGVLMYGQTGTTIASRMFIIKPRSAEDVPM